VGNANDGQKNSVPAPNVPPPPTKEGDGGHKDQKQGKEEIEGKLSHSTTTQTCEGFNKCTDDGDLLACILKTGTYCSPLLLVISSTLIDKYFVSLFVSVYLMLWSTCYWLLFVFMCS